MTAVLRLAWLLPLALVATPGAGAPRPDAGPTPSATGRTWPEIKCARYRQAWTGLLRQDDRRYGRAFVDGQSAFIASGCTAQGHVCPRSADELAAADTLTILSMNGGAASTFLPFGCRPPSE